MDALKLIIKSLPSFDEEKTKFIQNTVGQMISSGKVRFSSIQNVTS